MAVLEEWRKNTAELKRATDLVENNLPRLAELSSIVESLREIVLSLNFQKANTIPKQTPPQDPNTGSLRPRDTTPSQASAATSGPWKENRYGEWIFANDNQPLRDTLRAAPDHTVILNGMKYKLSGSPQEPEKFINRSPVGPKT